MKRLRVLCVVLLAVQAGWTQTTIDLERQVRGELPVAQGGTGAADAASARANLGLTTDYLDEDHTWLGRQDVLNFNKLRYAHLFAASGTGTAGDPWVFAAGNPWADAVADGGQTIIFSPGSYLVHSCPAIIPNNTTLWSFNRQQVDLRINCHGILGRLEIVDASNTTPIQITTASAHGFTTGDSVNISGVPGNNAANGDWQLTVVDQTRFTLNGSSGNGDFVNTGTGYWAGKISVITNISDSSPIEITTATDHGLTTGDCVLVADINGFDNGLVRGQRQVTVTGPTTLQLDQTAFGGFFLSGGTVRGLSAVDVIGTRIDGRGVWVHGISINPSFLGRNFIRNAISMRASESVWEEIAVGLTGGDYDQIAPVVESESSGVVTFTANGNVGQTVTLEMTGGGSRATASYPVYTTTGKVLPPIDRIDSPIGGRVTVHFTSGHGLEGTGEILTISSTAQTDAAGASGTWHAGGGNLTASTLLLGATGTGAPCTAGCGGATGTHTALRPGELASSMAAHLNAKPEFSQDYQAVPRGPALHLLQRKFAGGPAVFEVTSAIPHVKTPWAATQRGGNSGLFLFGNGFSSRFSRIFCSAAHPGFHCVTLQGINNQHSFRDLRLSGGNNAGWGMRFTPSSNIQNVSIDTMTVEGSYGGLEIASLTGSNISGLYMEAGGQFGVRMHDTFGAPHGSSFVHANTIANGFLLGQNGLLLGKGRDLAVENSIIPGTCLIGSQCENCMIRSSFANECVNESLSGYLENHSAVGKPPRGVDRYGDSLATPRTALLNKAVTNYVKNSEDLTAPSWNSNGNTSLVTATNPFGTTQLISRASVLSPSAFSTVHVGIQDITGLVPDTLYTVSHWLRVITPGATCLVQGAALVNRQLQLTAQDGWVRVAGAFRSSPTGTTFVAVGCLVPESGLPDFTVDSFGVMISALQNSGALPPYIPTQNSTVTVPPGMYAGDVELSGALASLSRCRNFAVSYSDLVAAASTEDIMLFELPARGVMTGVTLKHGAAFTGGALTGMTVKVGDSSDPAAYSDADGFNVFQTVSDTAFEDYDFYKSTTFAARNVVARFEATGGNTSAATAGQLKVTACYAIRP